MIDEDRTLQLFGYTSNEIPPKTKKPIVCVCEMCGRYRVLPKQGYHDLCKKCVQIQRHIDNPKLGKEHSERLIKLNKEHPEIGNNHSEWLKQYYIDNPEKAKKKGEIFKEYWSNKENLDKNNKNQIQYYIDNPDARELQRLNAVKQFSTEESRERVSARSQGQDYDAGEWTGFTDHGRPYLVPKNQCIHLNPWFEGCNQHHIMTGVIINIPVDLHKSTWHRIPHDKQKGKSMKKINKLAFKYLLGRL